MIGAVVPVEGSAQTAQDYEAWDANPCSVSAANTVVSDISQTVRSIEAANPTVRNVVIVGADDSIPMARIPDQTTSDNESSYGQAEFAGINDQLSAALSQGYFLSDDPYASPTPLLVGGQELYTPSLAVGRLVETPTEIDQHAQSLRELGRRAQRQQRALDGLRLLCPREPPPSPMRSSRTGRRSRMSSPRRTRSGTTRFCSTP